MIAPLDLPSYGYRPADPSAAPVVSIITPYFNTGALFLETATTLLRQSLQQWEWIIVNDGTTDPGALRVLIPFHSADPRIRVIDQPNGGPSAARNTGIAASRAPLLFFFDSDDLIAPTMLEKLAWMLASAPEIDFATAHAVIFGAVAHPWRHGFNSRYHFPYVNTITSATMVRRAAFARTGLFDPDRRRGLEDWEFWVRSAERGVWGRDLAEPLIWVRRKHLADYQGYQWAFQTQPGQVDTTRNELQRLYPRVFRDGPPLPMPQPLRESARPFDNRLHVPGDAARLLILIATGQIAGAAVCAFIRQEHLNGTRVSVVLIPDGTRAGSADAIQHLTPDIFDLDRFLAPDAYARFLAYLIESRTITTVAYAPNLHTSKLITDLRACCPHVTFHQTHALAPTAQPSITARIGLDPITARRIQWMATDRLARTGAFRWMRLHVERVLRQLYIAQRCLRRWCSSIR